MSQPVPPMYKGVAPSPFSGGLGGILSTFGGSGSFLLIGGLIVIAILYFALKKRGRR